MTYKTRSEGIKEGMEKGQEEGRTEAARNMLAEGFGENLIAKRTGLSKEIIVELEREL